MKLLAMSLPEVGEKLQFPKEFCRYFIRWLLDIEQATQQELTPRSVLPAEYCREQLQEWFPLQTLAEEKPSGLRELIDTNCSNFREKWELSPGLLLLF